jgi:hypothetical protein
MTKPELLPLRQTVTTTGEATVAFATQGLLDDLSRPGRYRIVRHGHGGQILAADEPALEQARWLLRQAYGALIDFGEPMLHTLAPSLHSLDSPS